MCSVFRGIPRYISFPLSLVPAFMSRSLTVPASVYILSGMLSRVPVSLRLFSRHLSIYLAGCYPAFRFFSVCLPAFSSSCSRDFSSALSSSRTSPQIAPVPLSVPACPPIFAGISARSALLCTLGSSTRLLTISLSDSL